MNLTPAKLDAGRILHLSDQWRTDAYRLDLDRAELSRHFNGGALQQDDEKAGTDRLARANILLGYKFLDRPISQLLSTYDEGEGMIEVKVENYDLPPSRRVQVERAANTAINRVIQASERLYWPYRACIGDSVINGLGVMYRDDPYDWAPKYGVPYFNWDAPADVTNDKFADWAFLSDLNLTEILARLDRIKSVPEDDSYWNRALLQQMAEEIATRAAEGRGEAYQPIQYEDPLEWQKWAQTQSWGAKVLLSSMPIVWLFSKRFDKKNKRPIDIYCVPRWGETRTVKDSKIEITRKTPTKGDPHNGILFYQTEAFESVRKTFFPFMLSCMVGGDPLMRRTMGLGFLMYDLDIRIQTSINNMFDGSDFDFSPLFQATDAQSEAELQELSRTTIRPGDILPAGARFMDKPKGTRPYSSVFELTQLMTAEMGAQAQQFHGGEGFDNKGRAELEVQVLERRQQLATALRLRMGDFIRRGDPLCESIGDLLFNEDSLMSFDRAHPQRKALIDELECLGVDFKDLKGKCKCRMRRPPGHGDAGLALARAQQTEVIARGLGPEAHRTAQRNLIAAVNGGDTRLAEEMVPQESQKPGAQESQALNQSSICLTTFIPAPVLETDNPMAHVPIHMTILQGTLASATETGSWPRNDQRGWEALAAHTITDIRILGGFDPDKAKEAEQAVKQMTAKASRIEISGGQPQVDPIAAEKLKLAQRAQDSKEFKMQKDIEHRDDAQEHRERAEQFQENLQLGHLSNTEKDSAVTRATKITAAAKEMATPIPQPTASE